MEADFSQIKELIRAGKTMPRTADGRRIYIGMEVWFPDEIWLTELNRPTTNPAVNTVVGFRTNGVPVVFVDNGDWSDGWHPDKVYSTREAAIKGIKR